MGMKSRNSRAIWWVTASYADDDLPEEMLDTWLTRTAGKDFDRIRLVSYNRRRGRVPPDKRRSIGLGFTEEAVADRVFSSLERGATKYKATRPVHFGRSVQWRSRPA